MSGKFDPGIIIAEINVESTKKRSEYTLSNLKRRKRRRNVIEQFLGKIQYPCCTELEKSSFKEMLFSGMLLSEQIYDSAEE